MDQIFLALISVGTVGHAFSYLLSHLQVTCKSPLALGIKNKCTFVMSLSQPTVLHCPLTRRILRAVNDKWGVRSLNYMWLCTHMHTYTHTCTPTHAHTYTPHKHMYTHKCTYPHMHAYTHAHIHAFIPTYALEAHLPKGMRIDQVKANNPRKICDAYVT